MEIYYEKGEYCDGTTAVMAYTKEADGYEYFDDVSQNISEYYRLPLSKDMIILPKYKMSKEFYDKVVGDIVEKENCSYQIGRGCEVILVTLKANWEQGVNMLS